MRTFLRRPLSLAQRLIILVAALALPLLVVVALSYNDQLNDRRGAESASATTAARNGAKIVEGFLRDLENTTFATAGFLGTTSRTIDQASFGDYLTSLTQQYPEIRAFFVTDANGVVTVSAGGQGVGTNLSTRSYVVALKAGAEKVWSGSITGLQSGDITVAFGRRIVAPDGTLRGFVVTAFYPEKLIQVLKPDYPADARLVLIDEKAHVVYDSGRTQPAPAEIDVSGAPGVKDALAGRTVPIDRVATPLEGEPQFGALVPIPRTGWVMSITRAARPAPRQVA